MLHAKKDQEWIAKAVNNKRMYFEVKEVISLIKHIEGLCATEEHIMNKIPNFKVFYEDDLENGNFQSSMDKLLEYLEIEKCKVKTNLIKKTKGSLEELVENFQELKIELSKQSYAKYFY